MKPGTDRAGAAKRPNFFTTPKGYVLLVLLGLAAVGAAGSWNGQGLIHIGNAAASAVAVDFVAAFFQRRKSIFPDGAVITGVIIGLVMGASSPEWMISAAAAIAVLSKHLLKVGRKPVFNPAAFGLLTAIYGFHSEQSWWGGLSEIPAWCILFVLIAGFLVARRVNKFPQVFAFLGTYYLLFLMIGLDKYASVREVYQVPFLNAALFMAFFMLTDPPTSPAKTGGQIGFGILAALVSVGVDTSIGSLAFLLDGLLAANLMNGLSLWAKSRGRERATRGAVRDPGRESSVRRAYSGEVNR